MHLGEGARCGSAHCVAQAATLAFTVGLVTCATHGAPGQQYASWWKVHGVGVHCACVALLGTMLGSPFSY